MLRVEAEYLAGAVDGQQGAELADVAGQLDAGEDLGQDFGRGTGEDLSWSRNAVISRSSVRSCIVSANTCS